MHFQLTRSFLFLAPKENGGCWGNPEISLEGPRSPQLQSERNTTLITACTWRDNDSGLFMGSWTHAPEGRMSPQYKYWRLLQDSGSNQRQRPTLDTREDETVRRWERLRVKAEVRAGTAEKHSCGLHWPSCCPWPLSAAGWIFMLSFLVKARGGRTWISKQPRLFPHPEHNFTVSASPCGQRCVGLPAGRAPGLASSVPGLWEPSFWHVSKASQAAWCSSWAGELQTHQKHTHGGVESTAVLSVTFPNEVCETVKICYFRTFSAPPDHFSIVTSLPFYAKCEIHCSVSQQCAVGHSSARQFWRPEKREVWAQASGRA